MGRVVSKKRSTNSQTAEPCFVRGRKPKNDDGYFEGLTHQIFQAGLNYQMVQDKWPAFQKALSRFNVARVANYTPERIDRLLANQAIIRNGRKIEATVYNARAFMAIQREYGSFRKYLRSWDGAKFDALQRDLIKRFKHVGPSAAQWFL
ncbi:MAG: DNA-3-methyladenine glycosylase I [Chloroflexi bacterium]|nr:DNA-3-methyladenine glycosylase I [Chloroflexota bacterium]